jgi:alpha-L-fucosidase
LVIDFGNEQNLCGFKYLPDQGRWPCAMITNYQFYVSNNKVDWNLVTEGEFSNIRNNPLMQIKNFSPVKARYIKLKTIKNTDGNNDKSGYAEVDIITIN